MARAAAAMTARAVTRGAAARTRRRAPKMARGPGGPGPLGAACAAADGSRAQYGRFCVSLKIVVLAYVMPVQSNSVLVASSQIPNRQPSA